MILPKNVKPKIGLWKILPKIFSEYTAQAIYPNVYLPEKIYKNLTSLKPKPEWIGVLIHEQTHNKRQKAAGPIKWNLKYIFSSNFRVYEELEANRIQFRYLKGRKIKFDLDKRAKFLSSWIYLWPDSYENLKIKLVEVWNNS